MVYFFIYWELSIRTGPWPGTHEPLAVHCVRRSGSSVVRTPLMLLPVDYVGWFFLCLIAIYPGRPWPGKHEPPSSLLRVAQLFERSENALGVAAGWFGMVYFLCMRNFYPSKALTYTARSSLFLWTIPHATIRQQAVGRWCIWVPSQQSCSHVKGRFERREPWSGSTGTFLLLPSGSDVRCCLLLRWLLIR